MNSEPDLMTACSTGGALVDEMAFERLDAGDVEELVDVHGKMFVPVHMSSCEKVQPLPRLTLPGPAEPRRASPGRAVPSHAILFPNRLLHDGRLLNNREQELKDLLKLRKVCSEICHVPRHSPKT